MTKLSQDWGYGNLYGAKPKVQSPNKDAVPTSTETTTGATGLTGGTMGATDFQYPDAWSNLQNIYSQMANGTYSNPAYNQGLDWTQMMANNGQPVDVQGWANAYKPAMMDEYSNMVKQMAEQAGVGGTRYGSGLQQSIANYGGQLQNQFNQQTANNWMGAQENAKNRQMQAGGMFPSYASLGLGAQQGGAAGLLGLGQAQGDYFSQAMQNLMGGGQYSNQMSMDPWTQMMAQMVGSPYYGQQTYNPSQFTNILGILGGMPWGSMFGGGGSPNLPSMDASGNFIPR